MTRRVLTVLICLLAGAIINVLVAWGCAAAWPSLRTTLSVGEGWRQYGNLQHDWSWHTRFGNAYYSGERRWTSDYEPPRERDKGDALSIWHPLNRPTAEFNSLVQDSSARVVLEDRVVLASGWPWLSMHWEWYGVMTDTDVRVQGGGGRYEADWLPKDSWGDKRELPLKPFMPGFLYGTLLYAAAIWLPTGGIAIWKRWLRKRRGQCQACAYMLKDVDHEVCPECGERLSIGARQAAKKISHSVNPRKRRWARTVRVFINCLAAGAIVNILVAQTCVFVANRLPEAWISSRTNQGVAESSAPGWTRYFCNYRDLREKRTALKDWTRVDDLMGDDPSNLSFFVEVESGLPFRAFNGSSRGEGFDPIVWSERVGLVFDDPIDGPAYPLRPQWTGFAANTVFYGVVAWVLAQFAHRIVRRRRLCRPCAYDLRSA